MQRLPAPADLAAPPRDLLAELAVLLGERAAAGYCAKTLDGADPHERPDRLVYLGGRGARALLDGDDRWKPWARVWAARGLLYVWSPDAAPAVVYALSSGQWRVAEMAARVTARRQLAAEPLVPLLRHELVRVRATAVRALGVVGDTEHVAAARAALEDPEATVRSSAWRACDRLESRLDVVIERPP